MDKGLVEMIWDDVKNTPIAIYEPGMWFGAFEVYKNINRFFTCQAMEDVTLYYVSKKKFKNHFFKSHPSLGNYFIRKINHNFKNLENSIKIVLKYIYPEYLNIHHNHQLEAIRQEAHLFSKISEIKDNTILGNT